MKNSKIKTALIALFIIGANMAIDQFTKHLAREKLQGAGVVKVIGNVFLLTYAENEGGFLSFGAKIPPLPRKILLTWLPTAIMAGMLVYLLFFQLQSRFQLICLATILGGGVSNLVDRFVYNGHVTDFMNFGIGNLRTGILNVADLSITFGAIVLILFSKDVKKQNRIKEPMQGKETLC